MQINAEMLHITNDIPPPLKCIKPFGKNKAMCFF